MNGIHRFCYHIDTSPTRAHPTTATMRKKWFQRLSTPLIRRVFVQTAISVCGENASIDNIQSWKRNTHCSIISSNSIQRCLRVHSSCSRVKFKFCATVVHHLSVCVLLWDDWRWQSLERGHIVQEKRCWWHRILIKKLYFTIVIISTLTIFISAISVSLARSGLAHEHIWDELERMCFGLCAAIRLAYL